MPPFDFSNYYGSQYSTTAMLEKLLEMKTYLSMRTNFIEFQDWRSEIESLRLNHEDLCRYISRENDFSMDELFDGELLADEIDEMFIMEELFDDEELLDELALLQTYLKEPNS